MLFGFTVSVALFAAPTPLVPPEAAKSVYKIIVEIKDSGEPLGSGTGWVALNKEGQVRIVTNSHVCVDNDTEVSLEVGVLTKNRLEDGRALKKIIFDPFADICVLEIQGDTSKEVALKLSQEPAKMRDPVYAIGHPLGGPLKLTIGYKVDDTIIPTSFYDIEQIIGYGEQSSCLPVPNSSVCLYFRLSDTYKMFIQPGNSGSPILDMDGNVVGMVWGYQPISGKGLGVTHGQLKRYLQ